MKTFLAPLLILGAAVLALSGGPAVSSQQLTIAQMAATVGGAFWGGVFCGVVAAGAILGAGAIITAAGAGATLPISAYFYTVAAAEAAAICSAL